MTPKQLHDAYPYQFSFLDEHPYMYERYQGWWQILVRLCRQVDELLGDEKARFRWVQIKEKWGTGRFYWRLGDDTALHVDLQMPEAVAHLELGPKSHLGKRIQELVHAAQEDTSRTCMVCGTAGKLDRSGWWLTLCPEHSAVRAAGQTLTSEFPGDEVG